MKRILGLDLGTNSIGWALIDHDFENKTGSIKGLGSRIIPMSQDILGKFDSGQSHSQTAERTEYRGVRRLRQRHLLRRERLHRVLNILGYLPDHYAQAIDFDQKLGQFKNNIEVKLNYHKNVKNKHEFIFMESFTEMVSEFKKNQPHLFYNKTNGIETKIPFDWTLYYLRKKALTKKISKEELSWILLNFNQKRGYYQLRGEEKEIDANKEVKFYALKVLDVKETDDKNAKGTWYEVLLEPGNEFGEWIYKRQSKEPLNNWIGKTKNFIITTTKDKDGIIRKRSYRSPKEDDWGLEKIKTQHEIDKSEKYVCEYIYESLLKNPTQKIRGKLIKTIERKYYKKELEAILKTQLKFHKGLNDTSIYLKCVEELYPRNNAHQNKIKIKKFDHLFVEDIIFYQRPLKSKKSTVSNCPYETRTFIKEKKVEVASLKCTSKSNPIFQEFRLWQFLRNLKIYNIEGHNEIDITSELIQSDSEWVELYEYLNDRKEVEQKNILKYFTDKKLLAKNEIKNYRWNFVEDKKYPSNTTRAQFLSRLKKVKNVEEDDFLTKEKEQQLWHIIYSVKDKNEFEKALESFARKNSLDIESFVENFKKFPPFSSEYAGYSEKAIKKLLPLMRQGKYWDKSKITKKSKSVIDQIMERINYIPNIKFSNLTKREKESLNTEIESVADDIIPKQFIKSFMPFKNKNPMTGLNTFQACYAVYERHSEVGSITKWKIPNDISNYLQEFKQHSLRNPIVEQVITETLRVVKDIWMHYGDGCTDFFDEIHVELGREMKNSSKKRETIARKNTENENTNHRNKAILKELMNDGVPSVRAYSPSHQEILKIYEEGVFQNPATTFHDLKEDDVIKIRKNSTPTKSEINKYKLWLEQGYISPYTGQIIPLSKLFTTDYEIEHIIPQSRYFDNSLTNKIICESEVNALKDNSTALEFIKNNNGRIVDLSLGRKVKLFNIDQYENHCTKYFGKNRIKLKNLLSDDIPEGFINRQLNDSRYISKMIKGLLSNIIRVEGEKEATSKNLIPVPGSITSNLKHDWGLNDKWNEIIAPRFKRLNELTKSNDYGYWDNKINAFRIQVPDSISRGFNKKRIDHRHHALDALVVACCTRNHTHYLSALNAEKENYGLKEKLLIKNKHNHFTKHFLMPWDGFTRETKNNLEKTIISFKQNQRIINKTNNKTWQWVTKEDGKVKKELVLQTKGQNWAIRKPMHKETVSGSVEIKQLKKGLSNINNYLNDWSLIVDKDIKIKVKSLSIIFDKDVKKIKSHLKNHPIKIDDNPITKIQVYEWSKGATATRVALNEKFTLKNLNAITDSGIKKILKNHLLNYVDSSGKERYDLAFNNEGLEDMNENLEILNNGKKHQPIRKVRIYEVGSKFSVGSNGTKSKKYVEAAKGTNLFFAIYWDKENQKRVFETVPLNEVIAHQKLDANVPKEQRTPIPINSEKGQFLFYLSPNDLVYIPNDEERENHNSVDFDNLNNEHVSRIYKMVSCTGGECHFIPNQSATEIIKNENGTNSKNERVQKFYNNNTILDEKMKPIMIKNICWKLKVDRLGNINKFDEMRD